MGITPTYTEPELVMMLRDRDNRSFSYLYDNYSGALYSIIVQILPDKELANDVLQEVFINIWRKIETYDQTKGRLFTWLLNIARNAAIDYVRSKAYQNSRKNEEFPEVADHGSGQHLTQMNIDHIGVKKFLGNLKSDLRVLIDLAYFKGYTHEEIAEIQAIPLGTVKTRIRSALSQLRDHLK